MLKLPRKRARFVAEYVLTLNGTQAAISAGYSEHGAAVQGHRLLSDANVQAAIQEAIAERNRRTQADGDEVVRWWTDVLRTDITQVATWDADRVIVVPSEELTEAQRKAVRKVRMTRTRRTFGHGDDALEVEETVVEVELQDQKGISELLAKHRGLLPRQPLIEVNDNRQQSLTLKLVDDILSDADAND